jgi:muramidase (phage lysozyme)
MPLTRYQWAAIAAALLSPPLYFLLKDSIRKMWPINYQLKNLSAFLVMIQYSEGTIGPNAYRMMYGGGLFNDYSRHPNKAITKYGITSTAAGAYQFLYRTWAGLQKDLKLPDFSPASQNKGAIELIRRRGALDDVLAGRFNQAIYKCRKEWASLPGAGYGQGERSIQSLAQVYVKAGGRVMAA